MILAYTQPYRTTTEVAPAAAAPTINWGDEQPAQPAASIDWGDFGISSTSTDPAPSSSVQTNTTQTPTPDVTSTTSSTEPKIELVPSASDAAPAINWDLTPAAEIELVSASPVSAEKPTKPKKKQEVPVNETILESNDYRNKFMDDLTEV